LTNLKANANMVRILTQENENHAPLENVDDVPNKKSGYTQDQEDKKAAIRGTSYSGNRRYGFGRGDRQKSVSKSIQR